MTYASLRSSKSSDPASLEMEEGVEGKIKGGVHTYGLTHCLHIVLGMHFGKHGVHPFFTKLLNHKRNRCAHRSTNLNQLFPTSILKLNIL